MLPRGLPASVGAASGTPSRSAPARRRAPLICPLVKLKSGVAAAATGDPPPLQPPTLIDAVVCDHRNAAACWSALQEAAQRGDKDLANSLAHAVAVDVIMHSTAEEQVLYPFCVKKLGEEGKYFSEHSNHEHEELEKKVLKVVHAARSGDMASLALLAEEAQKSFEHHKHEEEDKYLPMLAAAVPADELRELTAHWVAAKHKTSLEQLGSKA